MYDTVYKNHFSMKTARQDAQILGNSTLLKKMNAPNNKIIQKADEYIPNRDTEPHLHLHEGGVTYTSVGHRHTTIVSGQHIVKSSITRVLDELEDNESLNAKAIIEYLMKEYDIEAEDPDEVRERDLRYKLSVIGDIIIGSERLSRDPEISDQNQLFRHENEINGLYEEHQEFIRRETEVPNAIEARNVVGHYP